MKIDRKRNEKIIAAQNVVKKCLMKSKVSYDFNFKKGCFTHVRL